MAVIFVPWESANARNKGCSPLPESVIKHLPAHHGTGRKLSSSPVDAPCIMGLGVCVSSLLTPSPQGGSGCVRGELLPLSTQKSRIDSGLLDRARELGFNMKEEILPSSLAQLPAGV